MLTHQNAKSHVRNRTRKFVADKGVGVAIEVTSVEPQRCASDCKLVDGGASENKGTNVGGSNAQFEGAVTGNRALQVQACLERGGKK